LIEMLNGWYTINGKQLEELEDGVIVGSFAAGQKQYPELFEKHYERYAKDDRNGLLALNTASASDGVFIYVPDNVNAKKNIQIVNMVYSHKDLMINQRNLFVIGKNASIKIVVCDHSMFFNKSFVNSHTEILADDDSNVEHYKLQNYSNITSQYTSTDILQNTGSKVSSNTYTLHGGFTRNDVKVMLNGKHSEIKLNGLYLMDRQQVVDNTTLIEHVVPECTSNEKYKGILDDDARGVFSGKIYVHRDAQKTAAYQLNRNLLLTDTAQVNAKPHLEIYADDVKCTHGAAVGQLDPEAMFYLRSRGIGFPEARMLLMYAFAHEIINEIKIDPLRERIDDLVARRLRGEMSRCNNCTIRCS
jgi:Fe-S cluster assembly protein SufD